MEYYKYRMNSLRLINIIYIAVFSILLITHRILFKNQYFNSLILSMILSLLLVVILGISFSNALNSYYERGLFIIMWVTSIIAIDYTYIAGRERFFMLHMLLLLISVYSVFYTKNMIRYMVMYLVTVVPCIVLADIEVERQLISTLVIGVILAMSYMKHLYDSYMFEVYNEANKSKNLLFENAKEAFALHEIITNDEGVAIDYRFISANPVFQKITGLNREDIIGKTVLEALPETEPYWINCYGEVAIKGVKKSFTNYSKELDRYYEVSAYPVENNRFVTLFVDVTDEIKNNRKLEHAAMQAERANLLKNQFLRDVNHRLRTPLNGIMGMLQLIDLDQVGEENRELFQVMLMEMRNSRNIVNQISKFVDIQGMKFEYTQNNIIEIINQEIKKVNKDDSKIELVQLKCNKSLLYFEKNVLQSVFSELLQNAIKHTKNNHVHVNVICEHNEEKQMEYMIMEVKDYGKGIERDKLAYIFNEFYHHDFIHIYKPNDKLSLPMCKQILINSGGDLLVESKLGEETTFIMKIPIYYVM